jgi:hypothetical protein
LSSGIDIRAADAYEGRLETLPSDDSVVLNGTVTYATAGVTAEEHVLLEGFTVRPSAAAAEAIKFSGANPQFLSCRNMRLFGFSTAIPIASRNSIQMTNTGAGSTVYCENCLVQNIGGISAEIAPSVVVVDSGIFSAVSCNIRQFTGNTDDQAVDITGATATTELRQCELLGRFRKASANTSTHRIQRCTIEAAGQCITVGSGGLVEAVECELNSTGGLGCVSGDADVGPFFRWSDITLSGVTTFAFPAAFLHAQLAEGAANRWVIAPNSNTTIRARPNESVQVDGFAAAGPISVLLPPTGLDSDASDAQPGCEIEVQDVSGIAGLDMNNTITITPDGADTIDGAASLVMNTHRESVRLIAKDDGTGWIVAPRPRDTFMLRGVDQFDTAADLPAGTTIPAYCLILTETSNTTIFGPGLPPNWVAGQSLTGGGSFGSGTTTPLERIGVSGPVPRDYALKRVTWLCTEPVGVAGITCNLWVGPPGAALTLIRSVTAAVGGVPGITAIDFDFPYTGGVAPAADPIIPKGLAYSIEIDLGASVTVGPSQFFISIWTAELENLGGV